jgi:hypothetical protein
MEMSALPTHGRSRHQHGFYRIPASIRVRGAFLDRPCDFRVGGHLGLGTLDGARERERNCSM